MSDRRPIGLFDSGVGGLTVAWEVFRLLPKERIIYFGDNAFVPYGGKPAPELIRLGRRIISFLRQRGVKCILSACNTSSAVSLPVLAKEFDLPLYGLIEPGAAAAIKETRSGRVGVVATEVTVKSGAYEKALRALCPEIQVMSVPAPRLVPLVESGRAGTSEAYRAVQEYCRPLQKFEVDVIILGCTHYPFLTPFFQQVMGGEVTIVDPARAAVEELARQLQAGDLLSDQLDGEHEFWVSGDPEQFRAAARQLWGFTAMVRKYHEKEQGREQGVEQWWPNVSASQQPYRLR